MHPSTNEPHTPSWNKLLLFDTAWQNNGVISQSKANVLRNNGSEMRSICPQSVRWNNWKVNKFSLLISQYIYNLTIPTFHDLYGFHVFQQITYETTLQLTKGAVGGAECTRIGKTAEVWVACKHFYTDMSVISMTFRNSAHNLWSTFIWVWN